jgi:hypothetical protein
MVPIKIFISWSGSRSRAMGEALRKWLPRMNQLIKPWMSAQDIGAGSMWFQETLKELKEAKFGIICLASDNLVEPWIHFEAGALLDIVGKQRICPYLLDIEPSDIRGPLSHFQAKNAIKENTREMLISISEIGDDIDKEIINDAFERLWPNLEESFNSIQRDTSKIDVPAREPGDMLQELLELVRAQSQIILEGKVSSNQKEQAEIIIKILKEGVYGTPGDIFGLGVDPLSEIKNRPIREKLEKKLLGLALKET